MGIKRKGKKRGAELDKEDEKSYFKTIEAIGYHGTKGSRNHR
jgi:hypothetical protein